METETPDPYILEELISISEAENNLELAMSYMQQLTEVAPSDRNELRLMEMQLKNGQLDEVDVLLSRVLSGQPGREEIHRFINELIDRRKFDAALHVIQTMIPKDADDWELKLKEILMLIVLRDNGTVEQSMINQKIEEFINLDLPDKSYSIGRLKQIELEKKMWAQQGLQGVYEDSTVFDRLQNVRQNANLFDQLVKSWQQRQTQLSGGSIRYLSGLNGYAQTFGAVSHNFTHYFGSYGNARIMAIQYLYHREGTEGQKRLLEKWDEKWKAKSGDFQAIWNRLCLLQMQNNQDAVLEFAASHLNRPEIEFARVCIQRFGEMSPMQGM
ncbi:MAG: hypothetical protein R3C11_15040 [Planctomycetaceae bacterium]